MPTSKPVPGMIPQSMNADHQRRTSRSKSPSSSSVVTVKQHDARRSSSGSRKPSRHSSGGTHDTKASSKGSVSSNGEVSKHDKSTPETSSHYSRWSQSSNSKSSNSTHGGNEHRRHSSFSKRFSFGTSQPSASANATARRSPSPNKKRRPVDIQVGLTMNRNAKTGGYGDQLAIPGGVATSRGLDPLSASSDGPRTPLLHIGQISSGDDMRTSPLTSSWRPSTSPRQHRGDSGSNAQPNAQRQVGSESSGLGKSEGSSRAGGDGGDEGGRNGYPNAAGTPKRTRSRKDREKKATLAHALQRANDAVQLDHEQNFKGAVEAYQEACDYLWLVLNKTSGEEDKQKLTTIRGTYTSRIQELQALESSWELPRNDESSEAEDDPAGGVRSMTSSFDGTSDQENARIRNTETRDFGRIASPGYAASRPERGLHSWDDIQARDESESESTLIGSETSDLRPSSAASSTSEASVKTDTTMHAPTGATILAPTGSTMLAPPSQADMPPPLSPRRPPPPIPTESAEEYVDEPEPFDSAINYDPRRESHLIGFAAESNDAWADNGQDSPGTRSRSSSHHSVSSRQGLRRKHLRVHSSNTEAEFDAALDAAVEAAYNEGYEPYAENDLRSSRDYLARASIIEPRTRPDEYFAQRNSIIAAANAHVAQLPRGQHVRKPSSQFSEPASELDSDEEERLLDQATESFTGEEISVDGRTQSTQPRESDSSSSSARTWGSSIASSLNTAGTSLSTVDEHSATPASNFKQLPSIPPPAPPPTGALPTIPAATKASVPAPLPLASSRNLPMLALPQSPSVQDRRSSGQGAKKLKIETTVGARAAAEQSGLTLDIPNARARNELPVPPKTAPGTLSPESSSQEASASSNFRLISSPFPTPFQCQFPSDANTAISPPTSTGLTPSLTPAFSNDSGSIRPSPQSASPINPWQNQRSVDRGLLKSHSSLSLRQKGVITPDSVENGPGTPMSFTFGVTQQPGGRSAPLNTPIVGAPTSAPTPVSNVSLFANEIHSAGGLYHPEVRVPHPPRPLEPCPTSQLLRPFWLMRRFYQTVAHPRGGYLSDKVFIPRDVWKVKNVKLKNVDDKISNCDLLTAALLKLGTVDTLDADAVLEEMQAFEAVLDQAQTSLSKKLGGDVGVQTVSTLFKDAPITSPDGGNNNEATNSSAGDTTSSGAGSKSSSKSSWSSWRKLRSKGSSAALSSLASAARESANRESVTMSTIPMTDALPGMSNRGARKDAVGLGGDIKVDGPHASYMGALARLCDAVQVVDRIARQVEDPGLKLSSPTHVGLELSARHAAEFFGFYVCRFVLQDIQVLADKFMKRASEWVLT